MTHGHRPRFRSEGHNDSSKRRSNDMHALGLESVGNPRIRAPRIGEVDSIPHANSANLFYSERKSSLGEGQALSLDPSSRFPTQPHCIDGRCRTWAELL